MCFHSKQSKSAQELKNRFKASFKGEEQCRPAIYNAFQFPKTPIIINKEPETIQLFAWGLIPFWAKNEEIRKLTLNAKVETLHEKPSFKNIVQQRCLIIADGFYEWQWLDEKGKNKQKYELALPENEIFAFAGLWSEWVNRNTAEVLQTYTILTTEANALMREIHNTKKRMPVIISKETEKAWLAGQDYTLDNDKLIAVKI